MFISELLVDIIREHVEHVAETFTQPIQKKAGKSSGVPTSHALELAWPVT